MTEKLEQHHVQYKEIHGQDVIIMVTPDEHRDIHRHRPAKMKSISKKVKQSAQARSPGGKQIEKRYAQSEIGQRTRRNLHADSKTRFFHDHLVSTLDWWKEFRIIRRLRM